MAEGGGIGRRSGEEVREGDATVAAGDGAATQGMTGGAEMGGGGREIGVVEGHMMMMGGGEGIGAARRGRVGIGVEAGIGHEREIGVVAAAAVIAMIGVAVAAVSETAVIARGAPEGIGRGTEIGIGIGTRDQAARGASGGAEVTLVDATAETRMGEGDGEIGTAKIGTMGVGRVRTIETYQATEIDLTMTSTTGLSGSARGRETGPKTGRKVVAGGEGVVAAIAEGRSAGGKSVRQSRSSSAGAATVGRKKAEAGVREEVMTAAKVVIAAMTTMMMTMMAAAAILPRAIATTIAVRDAATPTPADIAEERVRSLEGGPAEDHLNHRRR